MLPKIFCPHFKYDLNSLKKPRLAVRESLHLYFRKSLNLPNGVVGLIIVIQTFGDCLNCTQPPIDVLAADRLFGKSGLFHVMLNVDIKPFEKSTGIRF